MSRLLPLVPLLLLTACADGDGEVDEDADYAVRVPLETGTPTPVPAPLAPEQPDDAEWRESADGRVEFGVEGSPPLLSLSCEDGAFGATSIGITRHFPADAGAGALLALVGNLRLRIPVDAMPPDRWSGSLAADDTRWSILDDRFSVTLPGGGLIRMPASPLARELRNSCRARGKAAQAELPEPADDAESAD